jgi:hypothetical protein
MDTGHINVGRKYENLTTEDLMGRNVLTEWQQDSGQEQPQTGANWVDIYHIRKISHKQVQEVAGHASAELHDRSEAVIHVPTVNATDIARNTSW